MRLIAPVAAAIVVSSPFAVTALRADEGGSWGFWGLVWAVFAGLLAFALTLWTAGRGGGSATAIGRWMLMATLAVLGLATTLWVVAWGVSPFSLEGMWMYPLAMVPLAIVAFMYLSRRRSARRSVWDRPPASDQ